MIIFFTTPGLHKRIYQQVLHPQQDKGLILRLQTLSTRLLHTGHNEVSVQLYLTVRNQEGLSTAKSLQINILLSER